MSFRIGTIRISTTGNIYLELLLHGTHHIFTVISLGLKRFVFSHPDANAVRRVLRKLLLSTNTICCAILHAWQFDVERMHIILVGDVDGNSNMNGTRYRVQSTFLNTSVMFL